MSIFKNIFCHKKVALLTLLLSLFVVFSNANAQVGCDSEAYKQGESIFKANCASCHKINQNLTGPALEVSMISMRVIGFTLGLKIRKHS